MANAFIVVPDKVSVGDTIFSTAVVVIVVVTYLYRDSLRPFVDLPVEFSITFVHCVWLVLFLIVFCSWVPHRLSTGRVVSVVLYVVFASFCQC